MPDDASVRAILDEVILSVGLDGLLLREEYNGRGMFGRTCLGVVCPAYVYTRVIEYAAFYGLFGAKVDQMGLSMIVYWPNPYIDFRCRSRINPT